MGEGCGGNWGFSGNEARAVLNQKQESQQLAVHPEHRVELDMDQGPPDTRNSAVQLEDDVGVESYFSPHYLVQDALCCSHLSPNNLLDCKCFCHSSPK